MIAGSSPWFGIRATSCAANVLTSSCATLAADGDTAFVSSLPAIAYAEDANLATPRLDSVADSDSSPLGVRARSDDPDATSAFVASSTAPALSVVAGGRTPPSSLLLVPMSGRFPSLVPVSRRAAVP